MILCAILGFVAAWVLAMQALNKRAGGAFTPADEQNLRLFGAQLGNTLVKAKLAEDARCVLTG